MQNRRTPIDLSGNMAVCDANYIRILKLLPILGLHASREISLPVHGPDSLGYRTNLVVLQVVEKFRYTTAVSIRLVLTERSQIYFQPPCMLVRMYHDASTAEVVSYQSQGKFHQYSQPGDEPEFLADEKQQVNAFLAEWLILCLDQGMGNHNAQWLEKPDERSSQLISLL